MATQKVGNKAKGRRSAKNKRLGIYAKQKARTERNKARRATRRQKRQEDYKEGRRTRSPDQQKRFERYCA